MWLIEQRTFSEDDRVVRSAEQKLRRARSAGTLTVVVGNGPSQSAIWLDSRKRSKESESVGWARAVVDAAKAAGVSPEFCTRDSNLLALAQAVFVATNDDDIARSLLMKTLRSQFVRLIGSTVIHDMIVDLSLADVVTTNYDFQIERAFQRRKKSWLARVRNDDSDSKHAATVVHKMHGTLRPARTHAKRYKFTSGHSYAEAERSIVIAEQDYDKCLTELHGRGIDELPLLRALSGTILVIGKAFESQDLSFLYALRSTRSKRRVGFVVCSSITDDERLNLENLNLTPLLIDMPSQPDSGHYYVGVVKALMTLFPDVGRKYEKDVAQLIKADNLIRAPHIVAIGLASQNVTGRIEYAGEKEEKKVGTRNETFLLPEQGRRNFRYEAEDHAGGSALTPLSVLAALDAKGEFQPALISIVGKDDIYAESVIRTCHSKSKRIDTDGISRNEEFTWHSTVLVHDGEAHGGRPYPGQRIFLDRGFDNQLVLGSRQIDQMKAQLHPEQRNLRVVYFDKFLAAPHPPNSENEDHVGPLLQHESVVRRLADQRRKDVDIVYETGGGGSQELIVEKRMAKYINILTAGFPFFSRHVYLRQKNPTLGEGMANFAEDDSWFRTRFEDETQAIEEVLQQVGGDPKSREPIRFNAPKEWLRLGRMWAGRTRPRRWMIVTLHHFGALAISLHGGESVYCPVRHRYKIKNTAGAGDTFRGAFCYALLKQPGNTAEDMEICTSYAVRMATQRCRYFAIEKAYRAFFPHIVIWIIRFLAAWESGAVGGGGGAEQLEQVALKWCDVAVELTG